MSIPGRKVIIGGMDRKKDFGELIAKGRRSAGLRAVDLAPKLGLSSSTLSYYETGRFTYPPEPELLDAIEREIGVKKRDLLEALGYLEDDGQPEYDADDPLLDVVMLGAKKLSPRGKQIILKIMEDIEKEYSAEQ